MTAGGENVRLDKWLWAARFFKTRSLATAAVTGGKVHLNGQRVKPARGVGLGDTLRIRREAVEFQVTVTGISGRRGPASEARLLYEESEESQRQREADAAARRLGGVHAPSPERRPSKRGRRVLTKLRRG